MIVKVSAAVAKVYVCIPPAAEKTNQNYLGQTKQVIEATKATLMNFSTDESIMHEGKYFYDKAHMNDEGAEVFTKNVLEVLMADSLY